MTTSNRVPVIQGLFTDSPNGPRLVGSKCGACGLPYFPKSAVCHNPNCRDRRMEDAHFGPAGKVWSFAVQHYPPPAPAKYDEPYAPYVLALVDMPEGLRVLARLATSDIRGVKIGMDVQLVLERLCGDKDGNEVITWMFRPV